MKNLSIMEFDFKWVRIEKIEDGYMVYHVGGEEWCDYLTDVKEWIDKVFLEGA